MDDRAYLDEKFEELFSRLETLESKNRTHEKELEDFSTIIHGDSKLGIIGIKEDLSEIKKIAREIKKITTGANFIAKFLVALGGFLLLFSETLKNWLEYLTLRK